MNLNYISLGLDYNTYISVDNDLRYDFQQHIDFINDFFSKEIRKKKFKTDGTFNMINIALSEFELKPSSIVPSKVLQVHLDFDKKVYEKAKETEDYNYYLELLEKGFKKANKIKSIPLDELLNLIERFKKSNYKNKWIHKKKRFKKDDLEVILTCELTTNYFQLWLTVNRITTNELLINEVVIRTETGISIHEGMFKDIIIENDIIITDKSDSPRIIISKKAILDKELIFEINGDSEIKEILSYEL
ncbi:hypothetical protein [uncultured Lacinutrix sp.]|uniref:hypothetical protein n=1 Tax=uncultured Lacinutrix sp. TaxID=574032 RepID=UPI0026253E37|nr:hypothetical protein [uncultured Lacinutrix sp.]